MKDVLCVMLVVGCFVIASGLCFGQIESDQSVTLEMAMERLEDAIEQTESRGTVNDVRQAAAVLSHILHRDGIDSAAGHLTLGNAYFIGDDLGRAILHYRRGLVIEPSNDVLRQNLAHARSFVEPTVPGDGDQVSVRSVLLSWQRVVDRWTLWYGAIGLLIGASVLWTIRMVGSGSRIPVKLSAGLAVIGVFGVGLLGFDQWVKDHERGAIMVMPGTGMYSGPGVGVYQEVYDGALGVGTEATVLDQRDGWANIRLSNAQDGWVVADSLVLIGDQDGL